MNRSTLALVAVFILGALFGVVLGWKQSPAAAPAPIPMPSEGEQPQPAPSPEPAPAPDPKGPEAKRNLIRVDSPVPNATVSSPLTITGQARGRWYFEASFPVKLLDADGDQIALGIAQAQDDWMTEDFVPFSVTLTFPTQPAGSIGTLVLEKDNPSGLPEHEDQLRFPVRF